MSKVKESIEEAREFAQQSVSQPSAVTPDSSPPTFIEDEKGEKIAYACEQERMNFRVRDIVIGTEAQSVDLATAQIRAAASLHEASEALEPTRNHALLEYRKIFKWPHIPPTQMEQLHEELSLSSSVQNVRKLSAAVQRVMDQHATATGLLEEIGGDVNTKRRLNEIAQVLKSFSDDVLENPSVTQDVVVGLRDLAHANVFGFLRTELEKKQQDVDILSKELSTAVSLKADATLVDDVGSIEEYSFREIELCEKLVAKIQKRLEDIFLANEDITSFLQNYASAREKAENVMMEIRERLPDVLSHISGDVSSIAKAIEEKTHNDAQAEHKHIKFMEENNKHIQENHRQQLENWDKIAVLFETNVRLAEERKKLVTDQIAAHSQEENRKAFTQSWFLGANQYIDHLQRAKELTTLSTKWASQLGDFVGDMCTKIEKKGIEEEIFSIRTSEQLEYLRIYRMFKKLTDELSHRKELRIAALNRVARNLELQIKEANHTLDPNKRKYEMELSTIDSEVSKVRDQLEALKERSALQRKNWKPIEELLEEARVDFEPPDISAEKEMCERKSEALAISRKFVNSEQEAVDRESNQLRKLKTANQVAVEGVNQRRVEKLEAHAASPKPAAVS